tara:strand:+ start:2283 stop:3704 length:1422 start_codon:yes stop_codon:yes gene_type:complete
MDNSGIDYSVRTTLGGNDRLLVYYNFRSGSGTPLLYIEEEGDDVTWNFGCIRNQYPASNTGLFSGVVTDSMTENVPDSRLYTTGVFLKPSGLADFTKSNLKVSTPNDSLNYSSVSTIFDVQFSGAISDGILFGGLTKTSDTIDGEVITGAKGFNFGINKRGKMFCQGFGEDGDFIYTANSIELSKRNLIAFSVDSNSIEMTRLDYLNQRSQSQSFSIADDSIANNDKFYLGGSENYFRSTSGEFRTLSGQLNEFALFSGYLSPNLMMSIGSGIIGNYFYDTGIASSKVRLTGFSQSETFKTGITGYDYTVTGTLELSTGREMITGSITAGTPHDTGEGARYFKYYTLNNGDVSGFYKEEVGFLHPSSGYSYLPTGENAMDTLGLRPVSGQIIPYLETRGIQTGGSVTINLYDSVPMTGILSQISGITQTPLTETVVIPAIPSSGIRLDFDLSFNEGLSSLFKKDFIYFLGKRL